MFQRRRDIREKYEAWWRCEGSILQFDTAKKHHAPPRIPSEVQDVGWLLAYMAERWVKEAKNPDWDWIWEVYRTSWDGTYFGGEAYPQVWLNLGPGVMAAYLGGYADFRGDTMWFELSEPLTWKKIAKLNYDPENPWWRFTLEAAHELGTRANEEGVILGTTDIGGVHDVLASLRGSGNIMTDFYDHAQELQRETDRILPLWHRYYHELDQVISLYQKFLFGLNG